MGGSICKCDDKKNIDTNEELVQPDQKEKVVRIRRTVNETELEMNQDEADQRRGAADPDLEKLRSEADARADKKKNKPALRTSVSKEAVHEIPRSELVDPPVTAAKRSKDRKGTGFVHKNTVPAVEDDEDAEQKNGQAARPAPLESPSGPLGPSGFGGHPPASPASSSSSPNCRSPASMRQSWQDLDADGNYNLGFNYRQGDRFGLQLVEIKDRAAPSSSVGLLVVAHVELSGPFAYTSKNSPGLFPGDLITKANGSRGTADTLRDIVNQITTAGGQLDLVVQSRPAAFDVQLKREGPNHKKLGLSVAIDKADTIARMRVLQVRDEGLIPKWNETNGLLRICRDDWITQVNGVTGNAKDMYNALLASSEGQELEFRVETPSRDAPRKEPETGSPMRTPQGSPQSSPNHRTS